MTHSRTKPFLP